MVIAHFYSILSKKFTIFEHFFRLLLAKRVNLNANLLYRALQAYDSEHLQVSLITAIVSVQFQRDLFKAFSFSLPKAPCKTRRDYYFFGRCGAFCWLNQRFWRTKAYFNPLVCSRKCLNCFIVMYFSFYFLSAFQSDNKSKA